MVGREEFTAECTVVGPSTGVDIESRTVTVSVSYAVEAFL